MENVFMGFAFSFVLTLLMLPPLIRLAKDRKLFVPIHYRKVHKDQVSALGGLALFSSVLISFLLFVDAVNFPDIRYVTATGLLMFFVGLRDDFHPISVRFKLVAQILAVVVLVSFAKIQIEFFQHFIPIPYGNFIDGLVTIVLMLLIINSFNFIDGIDMLASLYAFIVFMILGVWFLLVGQFDFSLLLLSLSGAFAAFMIFNYSPSKIFMGDTGTLSVGLLLAVTIIKFDEINSLIIDSPYHLHSAPALAFGFISIPIIDLLRVVAIRIFSGKSPFVGDQNHIHHLILKLGWSQNKVAFSIGFMVLSIILFNFLLDYFLWSNISIIVIDTVIIGLWYSSLYYFLKKIEH